MHLVNLLKVGSYDISKLVYSISQIFDVLVLVVMYLKISIFSLQSASTYRSIIDHFHLIIAIPKSLLTTFM